MKSKYVNGCEKCTPNYPCREHGAKGQTTVMDKPSHTPTPCPHQVMTYLDGLEAAVDGRSWGPEHTEAKEYFFRAVHAHEGLVASLKEAKKYLAVQCYNDVRDILDRALAQAGEK